MPANLIEISLELSEGFKKGKKKNGTNDDDDDNDLFYWVIAWTEYYLKCFIIIVVVLVFHSNFHGKKSRKPNQFDWINLKTKNATSNTSSHFGAILIFKILSSSL